MEPARSVDRQIWRQGGLSLGHRSIPEEAAVAITYNGGTYAVMMATPLDPEDFAVGFSLSEGIINSSDDIASLDIVGFDGGIEFIQVAFQFLGRGCFILYDQYFQRQAHTGSSKVS